MELMMTYTDIHVPKMSDAEFHSSLVSCVDLMALRKGLSWYQLSHNAQTHREKLCDCTVAMVEARYPGARAEPWEHHQEEGLTLPYRWRP